MTSMKQGLLLVAGVVVFGLSACGGQSEDGHSDRDGAHDGTGDQADGNGRDTEAETDAAPDPSGSGSDDDAVSQGDPDPGDADPGDADLGNPDPGNPAPGDSGPQPVDSGGLTPPVCADRAVDESEQRDETDGQLSCDAAFAPCGGDVVGTWRVRDCPLELTGQIDVKGFGLGCSTAEITSGTLEVSGTWTADESGNVVDCTITRGVQRFEMISACFDVAVVGDCDSVSVPFENALGYATVECADNPQTGGCTCDATIDQRGGLATLSHDPLEEGRYSITGTSLTTDGLGYEVTYDHCVMDDTLTLTIPAPRVNGLVEGSIVLERQ